MGDALAQYYWDQGDLNRYQKQVASNQLVQSSRNVPTLLFTYHYTVDDQPRSIEFSRSKDVIFTRAYDQEGILITPVHERDIFVRDSEGNEYPFSELPCDEKDRIFTHLSSCCFDVMTEKDEGEEYVDAVVIIPPVKNSDTPFETPDGETRRDISPGVYHQAAGTTPGADDPT